MRTKAALQSLLPTTAEQQAVDAALIRLKEVLLGLPATSICKNGATGKLPLNVSLVNEFESLLPNKSARGMAWTAPKDLQIVGSYLPRVACKLGGEVAVDLAFKLPSSFLSGKASEVRDFQYLDKRALYVAQLAVLLREALVDCRDLATGSNTGEGLSFSFDSQNLRLSPLHGNALRPAIVIPMLASGAKCSTRWALRMLPWADEEGFGGRAVFDSLLPDQSNVRHGEAQGFLAPSLLEHMGHSELVSSNDPQQAPSAYYNAAVLEDLMHFQHLRRMHKAFKSSDSLRAAVVLLKLWWHNHSLNGYPQAPSRDAEVTGFFLTMVLLHLLEERSLVSASMSPHLVLINTLTFLSTAEELVPTGSRAGPSLFDPSGVLNLAYLVSHSQFKYLSHVAGLSLARIADFDYLFSRRLPFWSRFDECLWIALPPSCLPCYALDPLREPLHRLTSFVIEAVLHRGLGERARLLCVSGGAVQCPDWQPYGPAPRDQHQPTTVVFFVGLRLCPATSHKMVVMGPPADHPAPALAFRELWGERAEIRRFKDGGINLTAVWQTPSHLLHTVTKQIVEYLLRRHVQHEEAPSPLVITHLADQLDARLLTPAEDTSVQIGEFFERLCSHIRQLDRLPLPIHTIRASSAIFSRTDLAPPQPSPHAMSGTSQKRPRSCDQHLSEVVCVKPFEAVIQFVPNGHWPGEVQAIERLKTAFFVEISEQLAAVTGIQSTPWETHLDVFLAGFVFRFFIHHPALLPLLKANDGLVLQEMRNSHVFRPDHVSFVLTLSNRFPAYARTVALAKHWVHLHMFSDFLREEAVELLVASVFCNSSFSDPADERGELPNRHLLAFLRFLQLVAFHPWSQEPLPIDSDGISFSPDSLAAIRTRFDRKNARKRIGMYLAPPYDRHCKFACDPEHPSQQILDRFVSYARQALQLIPSFFSLEPAFLESSSSLLPADAFDRLYQPSYTEFDLVIQLDKHACLGKALTAKQRHRLFGMQKYQNLVQGDGRSQLLVGFDAPAHFLSLLKQRYGKFAMFFVDGHRQSIIGLVWKPKAFMPKTFHPAGSQLMMPIDTLGLLLPNIIEIISEINLLGSGLIKKLIRK